MNEVWKKFNFLMFFCIYLTSTHKILDSKHYIYSFSFLLFKNVYKGSESFSFTQKDIVPLQHATELINLWINPII